MDITVVVGNPKPRSRTWDAAHRLAEGLGAGSVSASIDVVDLVPALLGWGDAAVGKAVERVAASDVELGAIVPAPALYLVDSVPVPDPVELAWLERWAPVVRAAALRTSGTIDAGALA